MSEDSRHHLQSLLMRESLLDKGVMSASEAPVRRMLPDVEVVKIGASSILDRGKEAVFPLIDVVGEALKEHRLVISTGGGAKTRHLFSIGLDLGLPTGVLAELSAADALGNAHLLGALLAPYGVVAIPPEILGHLLPLFIRSAPGVVYHGVPPYSLWEHPPEIGRIPPHRSDAGAFLIAEGFGCSRLILVKDVDGLFTRDPKTDPGGDLIREIDTTELRKLDLPTLPFERVLLDLLDSARHVPEFQLINGLEPERLTAALAGEHVGTIVRKS